MEVSTCRNNFLFYDPKAAERDAANILSGSEWNVLQDDEISKIHKSSEALRARVCEVIYKAESFFGLSLEALRASRDFNPEISTILQCKRISHALNLKGYVRSPEGNLVKLNGFYETFTIPMVGTSLLKWASKNPKEQEKAYAVLSLLTNALFYDHMDEESCKKAFKDLEQGLPVLIGSGYDCHSIFSILIQGKDKDHYNLISCNRGKDSTSGKSISGWNIYKIGKIEPAFIKHLASSIIHTASEYLSCQKLVEEYDAQLIYQYPMKEQKVGNCTYTNLKATISAFIKIWEKSNGFKEKISDAFFSKLEMREENESYKSLSWADKQYVLEDFLIDIKENKEAQHVKPVAKMIYKKLMNNPTIGFKISWKLWLETVELCQTVFPKFEPKNPYLISLVKEFIAEDNSSENEELFNHIVQIILLLTDKGINQQKAILNTIKFFKKKFVDRGEGINEAKLISLKLFQKQEISGALSLLIALLENKQIGEEELEVCKSSLIEAVDKIDMCFPKKLEEPVKNFIKKLLIFGKEGVVEEWIKDPNLEEAIKPLL